MLILRRFFVKFHEDVCKLLRFVVCDDERRFFEELSEHNQLLGFNCFFRARTSHLINLEHVVGVVKNEIEMQNGEKIPLARGKREDCLSRLSDWAKALKTSNINQLSSPSSRRFSTSNQISTPILFSFLNALKESSVFLPKRLIDFVRIKSTSPF